jgi:hypothetical protein
MGLFYCSFLNWKEQLTIGWELRDMLAAMVWFPLQTDDVWLPVSHSLPPLSKSSASDSLCMHGFKTLALCFSQHKSIFWCHMREPHAFRCNHIFSPLHIFWSLWSSLLTASIYQQWLHPKIIKFLIM